MSECFVGWLSGWWLDGVWMGSGEDGEVGWVSG